MRYLLILICAGCAAAEPLSRPHTPVPTDTELCGAAQTNLEKVCPRLAKTPAGKPYGTYCREAQTQNFIALNPKCASTAKNCQEADACPQQP
jgi:hypothetical protein